MTIGDGRSPVTALSGLYPVLMGRMTRMNFPRCCKTGSALMSGVLPVARFAAVRPAPQGLAHPQLPWQIMPGSL